MISNELLVPSSSWRALPDFLPTMFDCEESSSGLLESGKVVASGRVLVVPSVALFFECVIRLFLAEREPSSVLNSRNGRNV